MRKARRLPGFAARSPSEAEVHAGRRTSGPRRAGRRSARTASAAAARSASPTALTSSPLKALRFSGRLSTTWRTGPCVSVITRGIAGSVAWVEPRACRRAPRSATTSSSGSRSLEAVDGPAKKLAKVVRSLKAPAKVNEALSGHLARPPGPPAADPRPDGQLDERRAARLARRRGRRDGRRPALGAGLASAVPTVATGYADWADTEPGQRHRAPDRDRPRRLQRDRRRRCSPPRWPPAPAARAAAASCSRWPAWARSAPAATSAATSPTPRASAST